MCLRSLFVLFLIIEIHPQGRAFLMILPYYSLYKMAIFAIFQNDVIFLKYFYVFLAVFPLNHLLRVLRVIFLYDFYSICKMGNFATLPNWVFSKSCHFSNIWTLARATLILQCISGLSRNESRDCMAEFTRL